MIHFGYTPNPTSTDAMKSRLRYGSYFEACPQANEKKPANAFLWNAVLSVLPDWTCIAQTIGDCVSHGSAEAATVTACIDVLASGGAKALSARVASEAIYGLRAEMGQASWQDGWWGSAAVEAMRKFGVVLRCDYSAQTGNPEHDLREYSGQKAKQWGYYGCGGKNDKGALDSLAKLHPISDAVPIRNFNEASSSIRDGHPVIVCSDVGYGDMKRDSQGFVKPSGTWAHCMFFWGATSGEDGQEPSLFLKQSWGKSASGGWSYPASAPESVRECTWRVRPEHADRMFAQGDSFAIAGPQGWSVNPLTIAEMAGG